MVWATSEAWIRCSITIVALLLVASIAVSSSVLFDSSIKDSEFSWNALFQRCFRWALSVLSEISVAMIEFTTSWKRTNQFRQRLRNPNHRRCIARISEISPVGIVGPPLRHSKCRISNLWTCHPSACPSTSWTNSVRRHSCSDTSQQAQFLLWPERHWDSQGDRCTRARKPKTKTNEITVTFGQRNPSWTYASWIRAAKTQANCVNGSEVIPLEETEQKCEVLKTNPSTLLHEKTY